MLQWITSRLFARTSGLVWIHLLAMAPRRRWWPPPPALLWMANASPPFLLLTHAPDVVVVVVLHVARATVCQWTSGGQQQMATRMDGRTVPNSDRDGWWQSIIINVGSTSVAAFRRRFFFFLVLSCERAYQQQQLACGPSDVGHVTRHAVSSRWDRNPGPDRTVMWVETSSAAARVERWFMQNDIYSRRTFSIILRREQRRLDAADQIRTGAWCRDLRVPGVDRAENKC